MENSKNPAFPRTDETFTDQGGLTKREYAAIMVMQGLLATCKSEPMYDIVGWAILQADELLKQLEK